MVSWKARRDSNAAGFDEIDYLRALTRSMCWAPSTQDVKTSEQPWKWVTVS